MSNRSRNRGVNTGSGSAELPLRVDRPVLLGETHIPARRESVVPDSNTICERRRQSGTIIDRFLDSFQSGETFSQFTDRWRTKNTSFRHVPVVEGLLHVSDRGSMSGVMQEPRTAVMLLAEASWKDSEGGVKTVPARVEDHSPGGACLRLGKSVVVGTRLVVQTRRERFSGMARYCRTDGKDYLVGVQRDKVMIPILPQASSRELTKPADREQSAPPATGKETPLLMPAPSQQSESATAEMQSRTPASRSAPPAIPGPPPAEPRTAQPPEKTAEKAGKARKPMRNKLFELTHWRNKPDAAVGNSNGSKHREEASHPSDVPAAPTAVAPTTNFEAELLPIEDIYRTAGIMNVRHGIHRVVEMMGSEHLRGLSREMKRAAVLMALDAAGIPVDQVLQDCTVRQTALDTYEANQKKQVEAGWARKAEENIQIEAELDRVKAHYAARIARNLESVEREKKTFSHWLTKKQQESQSISEAADLFVHSSVPEAATAAAATKS